MTTLTASASHSHHPGSVPEVVAGITNDGSASLVAGTAVGVARSLGGRVRFVQVLPEGLDAEERADAESVLFGIAMSALRGQPRVQATFESPAGDPGPLLVDRSRVATALVVGRDQPGATTGHTVAAYCQTHSGCRVVVVPDVPSLTTEPENGAAERQISR